uniref:Uncharacterized protein n=1 Tax=Fagus sylvatica TaxID=28930 RepID=A0A2N9G689_FAGSY
MRESNDEAGGKKIVRGRGRGRGIETWRGRGRGIETWRGREKQTYVVKKVRRRIKKEKLEGLTREGRAGGDDIVGEGGEVDIREDKARTETKKVFRGKEVDQGMK